MTTKEKVPRSPCRILPAAPKESCAAFSSGALGSTGSLLGNLMPIRRSPLASREEAKQNLAKTDDWPLWLKHTCLGRIPRRALGRPGGACKCPQRVHPPGCCLRMEGRGACARVSRLAQPPGRVAERMCQHSPGVVHLYRNRTTVQGKHGTNVGLSPGKRTGT